MLQVKLNENTKLVEEIRQRIKENDGYCCCAIQRTSETKCMCQDFRDKIEKHDPGECHCGLYVLTITK